jgi:ParB family chromosome partitioning protein
MTQQESSGKQPVKKLGRGLSALLGNAVQVKLPGVNAGQPAVRAGVVAPEAPSAVTIETVPTPLPERSIAPAAPVEIPSIVPRSPVEPSKSPESKPHSAVVAPSGAPGLREIPVEQIVPNARQPRTDFDDDALKSLAESIRQAGIMQPVLVRPQGAQFELVAGERRWRAAKLAGLTHLPAVVRTIDDQTSAELALIENIQREDLNPMERAIALRRLSIDFSLTHQEIADRVGLDRATVTNLLRLSDLDRATANLVRTGKLSQGHAKALLGLSDLTKRASMAARCVAEDWSVRALEREVQKANQPSPEEPASKDPTVVSARDANVADLERQLAEHLGTRVSLQLGRKKGSGRLVVEFYNLDQFDGLMARIGFGASKKG